MVGYIFAMLEVGSHKEITLPGVATNDLCYVNIVPNLN
jgi:hypothetical protein